MNIAEITVSGNLGQTPEIKEHHLRLLTENATVGRPSRDN